MIQGTLVGSFTWDIERGVWVGVIIEDDGAGTGTVVSVGVEASKRDIVAWINATIQLMRQYDVTTVQVPDMVERANLPPAMLH